MNIETKIAPEAASSPIDVVPTGKALGAELRGVDLKSLDDAQATAIMRAFHQHQVILIRDQTLGDQLPPQQNSNGKSMPQ